MWLTQRSRILLSLVLLAGCDGSTAPKNADGDGLSADEIRAICRTFNVQQNIF